LLTHSSFLGQQPGNRHARVSQLDMRAPVALGRWDAGPHLTANLDGLLRLMPIAGHLIPSPHQAAPLKLPERPRHGRRERSAPVRRQES